MQQELLELFSPLSLSFESVTVMLAGENKTDKQTNKQINPVLAYGCVYPLRMI